eukprot:GILK01000569.1.p1 GENE.GILK01000569.1~~GILK01000569.1.p1  ORF type:complete len:144 (+),score=23.04 GILK01000569.1:64-432(+)
MTKLFVGGLSWNTTDDSLRDAFAAFGEVESARVITDRESGRSRGFGFVSYVDPASATAAMEKMNGAELDNRTIKCDLATERAPGAPSGGRGGFRGGYRGGRGSYGFSNGGGRGGYRSRGDEQ